MKNEKDKSCEASAKQEAVTDSGKAPRGLDRPEMQRVDYWNMKARQAESQRDRLLSAARDAMEIGTKSTRETLVEVIAEIEGFLNEQKDARQALADWGAQMFIEKYSGGGVVPHYDDGTEAGL